MGGVTPVDRPRCDRAMVELWSAVQWPVAAS
jgi:hypothetical protein